MTRAVNTALAGSGGVLQVVSATKTDTFTTTSTSYTDITGLSVSITPTDSSSRIMLIASICALEPASNTLYLRFVRGSTAIGVGVSAGSRTQATSGIRYPGSDAGGIGSEIMCFLDSPATTSALTYKVQIGIQGGTAYVNRAADDPDIAGRGRFISTITAMEIAG